MTSLRYLDNVTTLELDWELCIGCGTCAIVCPQAVFEMADGLAQIRDRDACMECGACSRNCETEAISVRPGVGCASAVLNAALGRTGDCCCVVEKTS